MIVGYPTETLDDHNLTLAMLKKYAPYAGSIISWIEVGSTLAILPGTPLQINAEANGIDLDKHENNWIAWNNEELTLRERLRRRKELITTCVELGYPSATQEQSDHNELLKDFESRMELFDKRIKIRKKIYQIRLSSQF